MAKKKMMTLSEFSRKGGKIGGKKRMASMTPEERSELARQGGLVGGNARAKKLSAKRRSEIARQAVLARWAKKKKDSAANNQ